MRLLLDEMYPTSIADQLRKRGHDVTAVTERIELRSLPDGEVFHLAQLEGRAIVSENIGDLSSIADDADERGQAHYGLVLIDRAKVPRGHQRTIGRLVSELHPLLKDRPSHEAVSLRHWL